MNAVSRPILTVGLIQQVVAEHYSLPVEAIRSKRRCRRIARPRQVAMYLASVLLPTRSTPMLGRDFQRDHTTVMHAVSKVSERISTTPEFGAEVAALQSRLLQAAQIDPLREQADRLAEDTADALRVALKAQAAAEPVAFIVRVYDLIGLFPARPAETPP